MCNKICITCVDIYCPWKGKSLDLEVRADCEQAHGYFKEFSSIKDLLDDLQKSGEDFIKCLLIPSTTKGTRSYDVN